MSPAARRGRTGRRSAAVPAAAPRIQECQKLLDQAEQRLRHLSHELRPMVLDDLGWLAVRVAMLGAEVEVHEPPELIEHLRVLGELLLRATSRSQP